MQRWAGLCVALTKARSHVALSIWVEPTPAWAGGLDTVKVVPRDSDPPGGSWPREVLADVAATLKKT